MFIQEQAENFYNSYLVLKESSKSFFENLSNPTSESENPSVFGRYPTMGVEVVCLSFSVELYIKCLHYVISQKPPKSHNILDLFRKLPNEIQQELFSYPAVKRYGWNFHQFERMIDTISNSFEKWRYSYESKSLNYNSFFAEVFVEAVMQSIDSERHRQ